MLRRLYSSQAMFLAIRGDPSLCRAIVFSQAAVHLSDKGNHHHLGDEARATWDESQLMTTYLQDERSVKSVPTLAEQSGSNGGSNNESDWTEPTLQDLDRSIPQVDCAFIADLIRSRNRRRKNFLEHKTSLKTRVEELSKNQAPSVSEAAKYPLVGALGLFNRGGSGSSGSDAFSLGMGGSDSVPLGDDGDAPVAVAPEVLAQLSEEERDVLLSSRPEYDDGFVLLDCRTVNEVTSWGMIEGAKVLPAHEMFEGFHLTPEEFEQEFGFAKPKPEQKIICYCQYGPRSLMAAQILSWMGYAHALHFRDGYYEWSKQYNLLLRRWMQHDKESGNEMRRQVAFQAGLELQREIAPEFNALPQQEAERYVIDTTRSHGTLRVGEGVREDAYERVAELVSGLEPPSLPGILDETDKVGSRSAAIGRRKEHMQRFLQETTGMDATEEESRPQMGLAEAQEKVLDAFTRRDGGSHAALTPRR